MIEHVVLFRCKKDTSPDTKQKIVQAARSMPHEISEILRLSSGENWSDRSDGYDLALVCRFESKETLDIYQNHQAHQRFVTDWVRPNVEKVLAVDYFLD